MTDSIKIVWTEVFANGWTTKGKTLYAMQAGASDGNVYTFYISSPNKAELENLADAKVGTTLTADKWALFMTAEEAQDVADFVGAV